MKSYVIHLIRNMPCQGNLEGRYIGRTDSPLADASLGELLELKTKFRYPRATAFYASPSTRCVDTLRILYPEADPEVIWRWPSATLASGRGKPAQELQNDPRFLQWMEEGGNAAPPEGESGLVFLQRVCRGFETLVQNIMAKGQAGDGAGHPRRGDYRPAFRLWGAPGPGPPSGCASRAAATRCASPQPVDALHVMEVYQTLPLGEDGRQPDHLVVDIAREGRQPRLGPGAAGKAKATLLTKPPARPIMPTKGKTVKGNKTAGRRPESLRQVEAGGPPPG